MRGFAYRRDMGDCWREVCWASPSTCLTSFRPSASSSGKTQFALQLCLMALLNPSSHKIERSACYISSSLEMRTERLMEIFHHHPVFASLIEPNPSPPTFPTFWIQSDDDVLSRVWHRQVESDDELIRVLSRDLPALATGQSLPSGSPLKLVENTVAGRRRRAKVLIEIAQLLRRLAIEHSLCVLVINNVTDVFSGDDSPWDAFKYPRFPHFSGTAPGSQAIHGVWENLFCPPYPNWFARTPLHLVRDGTCERQKEALLGFSWASQLNGRIMLSRTTKHAHVVWKDLQNISVENVDDLEPAIKPRSLAPPGTGRSSPLGPSGLEKSQAEFSSFGQFSRTHQLRKLTLMFRDSRTGLQSMDFAVLESGLHSIPGQQPPSKPQSLHAEPRASVSSGSSEARTVTSIQLEPNVIPTSTETDERVPHGATLELGDSEWEKYYPELFGGGEVDLFFDRNEALVDQDLCKEAGRQMPPFKQTGLARLPSAELVNARTLLQSNSTISTPIRKEE
ncbi:uncharacterized protein EI90DRAFT_3075474 [Cantharellus anzutake]|uniref:uncharacterized protein n=1 Tax=Cantharellus anzutake TaxID=1750568 RepID=UPI001904D2DE|nr:uncharacterized protein EI90DRAFT_3075474 [Cantharellus anzutake]KAF8324466.1 hypothetical protein EI90DRAFT_3075474 [Cantharellus anzutake]